MMIAKRATIPIFVVALVALVGCPSTDALSKEVTKESFADFFCDVYSRCCGTVDKAPDTARCRTLLLAVIGPQFDPVIATPCAHALRDDARNEDFCAVGRSYNTTRLCQRALREPSPGVTAPGGPCSSNMDCAPTTESDAEVVCAGLSLKNSRKTKCQLVRHGKAGDAPCTESGDQPSENFSVTVSQTKGRNPNEPPPPEPELPSEGVICWRNDGVACDYETGTCVGLSAVGEECGGGCLVGHCQEGICVAGGGSGENCSGDEDCDASHFCEDDRKKCVAKLPPQAPCNRGRQCTLGECPGEKCDALNILKHICAP